MDLRAAKKLIAGGESQHVEFKKKANHPEKIIREMVAFANTAGGDLFVGVDDDGIISGLKYPEEDEYELTKAIRDLIRPAIDFEVKFLPFREDCRILHYHIPESDKKPHFAFLEKRHKYGRAFVRVSDHSIQASYEVRQILKRSRRPHSAIEFEEKTRMLFKYFEENDAITLEKYAEISGLSRQAASGKLIQLAVSGALSVSPQKGGDLFRPAP